MDKEYEIIVVGGGHAGCEACLAAARMGRMTLLLTMDIDKIGHMSCNPSIGGLAKGQLVKEIDALGGEMARAADGAMLQFRMLNTKKGPAVRSSRIQADRTAYKRHMQSALKKQRGLTVKEATAQSLLVHNGTVYGVRSQSGERYRAKAVIVTAGTFLNGLIHIGLESRPGGRMGERSSSDLSKSLAGLGLRMGRLKTGTCARIDSRTIDFRRLKPQPGDKAIIPMSFGTKRITRRQVPCYITYTNGKTHEIIRSNLDRSPLFTGVIKGTGVRYCPSIEDKIYRFPERESHHIFLEPEGSDTYDYYPNGISTSLPLDVQEKLVHSIEGLEKAVLTKPGYGIEYDYVDPTDLYPTLEAKSAPGLYIAGQLNGTTGYEEAASLGLMAGINAALKIKGNPPLVLERSRAYIGVLIDDLVTKGTQEPYRMFTSRVEYRLSLREDNADIRLAPLGYGIGLLREAAYKRSVRKSRNIKLAISKIKSAGLDKALRRQGACYRGVVRDASARVSKDEARVIENEIKYESFIERQNREIERLSAIERIKIPGEMDYKCVHGLSSEIKEKLEKIAPLNLGQAARISGVTPAAISILMVYIAKSRRSAGREAL